MQQTKAMIVDEVSNPKTRQKQFQLSNTHKK